MVLIIFAFGIRTSWFQTFLAQQVASYLSNQLKTEVRIDKVDIVFFDLVDIEGVYVEDKIKDTLLYSEDIRINISDFSIKKSFVDIEEVALTNANVNIIKYKNDSTLNFQHIVDYFASDEVDTTASADFKVNVQKIALNNINFVYQDQNAKKLNYGVDYSNLAVKNLSGEFSDFGMEAGVIQAKINNLHFKERSGLVLTKFSSDVSYSSTRIGLANLVLGLNNSVLISDSLELLTPNGASDFSNFVHNVRINGNVRNTRLDLVDIGYFVPAIQGMDAIVNLNNIDISGQVYGLKLLNTDITLLDSTIIRGDFQIPDLDHGDVFFQDKITHFQTTVTDVQRLKLTPFLGGDDYLQLPSSMAGAGLIQLKNGHFTGVLNNFVVDGDLTSGLGNVTSEYGLKFKKDSAENIYYYESGREGLWKDVQVTNLDLGALSGNSLLGKTTGYLSIGKGSKGLNLDEMDIKFKGQFDEIMLNDYNYNGINIRQGRFANEVFTGVIDVKDDNLALNYDGSVDLKGNMKFKFDVLIDSAVLSGLTNRTDGVIEKLKSKIHVEITGTSLETINGSVFVEGFNYQEDDINLNLDSLRLKIKRDPVSDSITLTSQLLDLRLAGKYDLLEMWPIIQNQLSRVANNIVEPLDISKTKNEFFDLEIDLKDVNPLFQFVEEEIFVAEDSRVRSNYNATDLKLNFDIASELVMYEEMKFSDIQLESHFDSVRANVQFQISKVEINDSLGVSNAALFCYVKNNKFSTNVGWDALGNVEPALFAFNTFLEEDKDIITEFKPSFFFLKSQRWVVNPSSVLLWNNELLEFTDFEIVNGDHLIDVHGRVSRNPKDWLYFSVRDFDLASLNGLMSGINIGGILNIEGGVADVYDNIRFSSFSEIKNFIIEGELVGDLLVDNQWDKETNSIGIKGGLEREKKETFKFKGNYFTEKERDNIELDLIFDYTDIGFLNAFADPDLYTDISGILNGKISISGEVTDPIIKGKLDVVTASVKVPMFNVTYGASGGINFGHDEIIVDYMSVTDQEGNNAIASMQIYHYDWGDWNYDITLDMEGPLVSERFLVMNTNYKDGDFYYGKAYITGDVNIFGYEGLTEITVNATTQPGTDIKLAMYGTGDLEESSFIVYDTIVPVLNLDELNDDPNQLETSGLVMNMNFNLTKETKATIIFDPIYEDQIEVEFGEGDLTLNVDEYGEMDMFGDYTILKGQYKMNVKGLVKKEFFIKENSTLKWTKSPYDAIIDIQASYKTNTSLKPIMPQGSDDVGKTKEDVFATLVMRRKLMDPEITFDISAPLANREGQDAIATINGNTDNLSKQFFALVALDRFLSTNGTSSGDGNTIETALEGQINGILESFDQGLTIDIGDGGSVNYERDLNEKLTIITSLGVVTGEDETNGLIGDIRVEYKLNEDGTFTVNAFNESNHGTDAEKGPFTQGVSLHYEETFGTWKESRLLQTFLNIFRKKENDVDLKKDKANGKKKAVEGARELMDTGSKPDTTTTGYIIQPQIKTPSTFEGSFVIDMSNIPLKQALIVDKRKNLNLINFKA
ncbi:MAG: hypothetical protein GQ574_11280 [Crocinitomix sp.]|nr:hypothetical protein [Crocinitomix sp.]